MNEGVMLAEDIWTARPGGWQIRIFDEPLFFWNKSPLLINTPDGHVINVATPFSGMSPEQILKVTPRRACRLQNARRHAPF